MSNTTGTITSAEVRAALIARREIALLDVREEAPFAEAHPLFAASLPLGRLELEVRDRIPRLSTQVVVYDDGEGLVEPAVKRLKALGYTDVARLEGGLAGWRKSGGELFRDVNVPSKAFGELVDVTRRTPSLPPDDLKRLLDEHADMVVLDARRLEEYGTMSIPGAVSVPGAELVYRVAELAPRPETLVVVNCAGRTRGIIGAQSLVNAGIPNRVATLRHGTIGWTLAGHRLDRGANRVAPPVSDEVAARAREAARRVADRAGVRRIMAVTLETWRTEQDRTTYCFDVRPPDEYEAGHLEGFRSTPGGQLVQETDVFAPVRGARIVLWDPASARADMTASWLAQMGWDVFVLDGVALETAVVRGPWKPTAVPLPDVRSLQVTDVVRRLGEGVSVLVDLAPSPTYRAGHIAGAWSASRTHLAAVVAAFPPATPLILTSPDGVVAALAAPELEVLTGGAPVEVLEGGTAAWTQAGLPLQQEPARFVAEPRDVYKRPYEGTDNPREAMEGYIQWEYGLVEQLERDGTHGFRVL
jgi:rhodanese-related sulfurtransferase